MEGFEYRNPYAAPTAQVQPTVAPQYDDELVKAGRLPRLMAQLADSFITLVIMIPGLIGVFQMKPEQGITALGTTLMMASGVGFLALVAWQFYLLYTSGQTLGKRWIGIRIVRSDGERCSFGRLLGLRYFVPGLIGAIPFAGPIFSLADPLWIFGEERRCLHDMIADTIVVND